MSRNGSVVGGGQLGAVQSAVTTQLREDGRKVDLDRIMGRENGYSSDLMGGFLSRVRRILKNRRPAYDFSFNSKFSDPATNLSVEVLISKINDKTKPG